MRRIEILTCPDCGRLCDVSVTQGLDGETAVQQICMGCGRILGAQTVLQAEGYYLDMGRIETTGGGERRMRIPIRAVFARGTKPGEEPRLIDATYAEVPDTLLMGTMAQAGVDLATARGDHEGAHRLSDAIAAASRDGKIQTI